MEPPDPRIFRAPMLIRASSSLQVSSRLSRGTPALPPSCSSNVTIAVGSKDLRFPSAFTTAVLPQASPQVVPRTCGGVIPPDERSAGRQVSGTDRYYPGNSLNAASPPVPLCFLGVESPEMPSTAVVLSAAQWERSHPCLDGNRLPSAGPVPPAQTVRSVLP